MRTHDSRILWPATLLLWACTNGGEPGSAPATVAPPSAASEGGAMPSQPAPAPPTTAADAAVPAVVTGVLIRRDDGIEVCPGSRQKECAGFAVVGDIDPAWLTTVESATVWKLRGKLDGEVLVVEEGTRTDLARDIRFDNNCPELQAAMRRAGENVNPSPALDKLSRRLAQAEPDRFAGRWWDAEHQTMVIWRTGDVSAERAELKRKHPGARLCLHGNAAFSERELEQARATTDAILSEADVKMTGSSLDVTRNRVVYDLDAIDTPTRKRIEQRVGKAVELVAFVEVPHPAARGVGTPEPRGTVELVTQDRRNPLQMEALGSFTVRFDPRLECVYLEDAAGKRVLPVWPFGYWAERGPLRIHDFDGRVVAREGEQVSFGGGHVGIEHTHAENLCGAFGAWVGSPTGAPR